MIWAARPGDTDEQFEQCVHVRVTRRSLLTQDDPIDLRVVLDEAVLSRPVGGDEVIHDQLLGLIEVARLPNVTIQILPFVAGPHTGMDGTFAILEFEEDGGSRGRVRRERGWRISWRRPGSCGSTTGSSRRSGQPPLIRQESIEMIGMLVEEPLWKLKRRVSGSI
jgi:hypothetical protein